MGFACYACRQPVSGLASRCPHCTSALGAGGSRDSSQDYAHLPPIYVSQESQDWANALVFGTIFKAAVIGAIVYFFWAELAAAAQWIYSVSLWIKSLFYGVLVWLFG